MGIIFNVLTHLLIIGSLIGCVITAAYLTFAPYGIEKLIRVFAVLIGLFAYIGAKAFGVTIPDLLFNSLDATEPAISIFKHCVLPSVTGLIVGAILIASLNSDSNIGVRVVLIVLVFTITLFGDVYSQAFGDGFAMLLEKQPDETDLEKFDIRLIPNVAFVLSLGMYIVLRYKTD